jgi:hypothetical protein
VENRIRPIAIGRNNWLLLEVCAQENAPHR